MEPKPERPWVTIRTPNAGNVPVEVIVDMTKCEITLQKGIKSMKGKVKLIIAEKK